jgi:hypothetical protein
MSTPTPKIAVFDNLEQAQDWRRKHGGHIFESTNGQCDVFWFDATRYTPSTVFLSPVLCNLSGRLV